MAFELKVLHTAPAITFCAENADKGTKEMINAMKVMRAVQLLAQLSMARLLRAFTVSGRKPYWRRLISAYLSSGATRCNSGLFQRVGREAMETDGLRREI